MSRPNYFNNIHKAVRAGLFETALQVARTDLGDLQAAVAAARSVVELMDFLDEHAAHEQGFMFPALLGLLSPWRRTDFGAAKDGSGRCHRPFHRNIQNS